MRRSQLIGLLSVSAVVVAAAVALWPSPNVAQAASKPAAASKPVTSKSAEAPKSGASGPQRTSVVMTAPRPKGGEYFGLYLNDKKVGFLFSDLTLSADGARVTSVTELTFKARVGPTATSERHVVQTKVYEAKPGGRLVSFTFDQQGDGGQQRLEGTATAAGVTVLRKRPGQPDETLKLKPSREVVEDADPVRVAIARGTDVEGWLLEPTDLEEYRTRTTLGGVEERTLGGVKVSLRKATTLNDKEKVPSDSWVDERGRMLEVTFGPVMKALYEPEDRARRLDLVEVFGLTRVVLPRRLPDSERQVPGNFTFIATGLPEQFRVDGARQRFKALDGGRVEVRITAAQPKVSKKRPLIDPNGGVNLKSTLAVESANPDIIAAAKRIAGDEKDAWKAAKAVNDWVHDTMVSDYGASADHAADVLRQLRGDCTEHSLLATALLRALGIPARRIDGVVYVLNSDGVPALYWHEWVEAYVGEWVQMDPTFGQYVADATHFALGEEASAEITPLIGSMRVLEVLSPAE